MLLSSCCLLSAKADSLGLLLRVLLVQVPLKNKMRPMRGFGGGYGDFGATHWIELSLRWGEKMRQLNGEQRAILREAKRAGEQGDYIREILTMNDTRPAFSRCSSARASSMVANLY